MSLFLKIANFKNGRTYLSIVDGYRDTDKKVKQKVIKKIGYVDVLEKSIENPIEYYKNEVDKMKEDAYFIIPDKISKDILLNMDSDNDKNIGYVFLKKIYEELGLSDFFSSKQKKSKIDYSLNKIFSLLVFSRILYPGSKRDTCEKKDRFFEPFDNIKLIDVYKSLDIFNSYKEEIELLLWNQTKNTYHRDISKTYYDCTNYYFEIDYNDTDLVDEEGNILQKNYRKRGPEKNHRPDPIVELGLLMDASGIPLAYDLFPGNESEKLSLRPIHTRVKAKFNLDRTIVVADRGLNTSDNIYYLAGKNDKKNLDGYIYGQSVRGADKEFKEWVLKQDDYTSEKLLDSNNNPETFRQMIFDENGNFKTYEKKEITFKHKSRIYPKTLTIKKNGKRTINVNSDQKQMVYYSQKYADKQKRDRNQMIERAKDLISNPKKYNRVSAGGAAGYINNIKFIKSTGEIAEDCELTLKVDKIQEEEKYDGYYSIVTSELKMTDVELRNVYRGLSEIENTFKITKSDLKSRPVYVWTKEHIESHFLTCFVALVIVRLLEKKTNGKYSIASLIEAIRNFKCIHEFSSIYMLFNNSEIIEELNKTFNTDILKKRLDKSSLKKILKY